MSPLNNLHGSDQRGSVVQICCKGPDRAGSPEENR